MENEVDNLTLYIDQVAGLIASLSNSMRQLSLSSLDLQGLGLTKKHQIEKTIDLVEDLGSVNGQLIKSLEKLIVCFIVRHEQFKEGQTDCRDESENTWPITYIPPEK